MFLNGKHGDKYYIINTSERATYDGDRYFGGRVTNYHWPDHHGPPFAFLYQIAKQGYDWLRGKFTIKLSHLSCLNSRPRECADCPLQLRQGSHRHSNRLAPPIHRLL